MESPCLSYSMKTKILVTCLLLSGVFSSISMAQCTYPSATETLSTNKLLARLSNSGQFMEFNGEPPLTVNDTAYFPLSPGLAYKAGLWMGGIDAAGQLRLAAEAYGNASTADYFPGPLGDQGTAQTELCDHFNRFWRVNRSEIDAHIADFNDNGEINNTPVNSIYGWPGAGNPYFQALYGFSLPENSKLLAPFVDQNADGIYDPWAGDYPKVKGDEAVLWFFNDGAPHTASYGEQLGMEVRATAYAFDRDITELDQTIFYEFSFHYKGDSPLDSFYLGLWMDVDIGCGIDDRIGCNPEKSFAFAHNGDEYDEDCGGTPGFGTLPLGLLINSLQGPEDELGNILPMSHFMYLGQHFEVPQTASGLPVQATGYYNYLRGRWRDGTPLSLGGGGYDPSAEAHPWAFDGTDLSGDPGDGWSFPWIDNSIGDRRFLMSYGPISLPIGSNKNLAFCMTWTEDMQIPVPSMQPLGQIADITQYYYDSCFEDFITSTQAERVENAKIHVFPNPMSTRARIQVDGNATTIQELQLFHQNGQLVKQYLQLDQTEFDLHSTELTPGVYILRIRLSDGQEAVHRVVVQ